ncbi:MAG: cell division protein FtsZ [Fimbriimonadaceae bacterium]|nr:cell division protein FtsZ [Fimbriimonadaceae bacterium]
MAESYPPGDVPRVENFSGFSLPSFVSKGTKVEDQDLEVSPKNLFETLAVIKVVGVGGAGSNAVNRMVEAGIEGVEFVAMNTDRQALDGSRAAVRLPLGVHVTRGLGAGGDPEVGKVAAKESEREIQTLFEGTDMVFIAAGMGGGTGSGAAALVARAAKQLGCLTVAVVTKPFGFEGAKRKGIAERSLKELQEVADTTIVVPNENLLRESSSSTTLQGAFAKADDVLRQGVQGIADIVTRPGMINVDFADVMSVMSNAGIAMMGVGSASGEDRARAAAAAASSSPMLDGSIQGAKRMLVNFTTGEDFSLGEIHDAMDYLAQFADAEDAAITMGQVFDPRMGDEVVVTLLATGFAEQSRAFTEDAFYGAEEVEPRRIETTPDHGRANPMPAAVEELDLDIPAFLRKQRSRT